MKSRADRHPARRVAGFLVLLVVVLLLAYPIAANLFLRLGGVAKAFEATDTVAVHFRRAWSFWPGRVHVEDLEVVMQDRNVQFVLRMPRVEADIDLWALKNRTFHATRVRGSGTSFRFRHRIEHESAHIPSVRAYPPVPGFDDPPLREFGPPAPPLTEENYNLWTVHIEDVDAEVSELWAQMMRYEGTGRVRGAFRLRPAKRLWVGPATLELHTGVVTTGAHDVLRDVRGKLTCKVDDFDTESVVGMEPFRFIFARLELSGQVAGTEPLNFLMAPSADFHLDDGSGLVDMRIAVDHGVFTRDSWLTYRTRHIGVSGLPLPVRLDGDVALRAKGPSPGPGGQLILDIADAFLQLGSTRHAPPRLLGIEASLATSSVDVTKDWSVTQREVRFRDIALADLRWLNDLPLGRPRLFQIDGGRGHVSGVVHLPPSNAVAAAVSASVEDAAVHGPTFKLRTTANIEASGQIDPERAGMASAGLVAQKFELSTDDGASTRTNHALVEADLRFAADTVRAELRASTGEWEGNLGDTRVMASSLSGNASIAPENVTAVARLERVRLGALGACPWAEIEAANVTAELGTPDDGKAKADVQADFRGASLRWGRFHAAAERSTFRGAFADTGLSARLDTSALKMKSAGGPPRGWEAEARSASISAQLAMAGGTLEGPAELTVEHMDGTVGKTRVRGDITGALQVSSRDPSLRIADVSGTIHTRNVALTTKQREIEGWWAELKVDKAHLDTRQNFDVTGKIKARFRDGLPALYVLASEDEIPGWVPGVLPLEGLTFDLHVERYCRWTDVQVNDARGGPLAAQGRMQIEPGETRGALLLRLAAVKPISVGLHFVEDYSSASPLVGADWLEKHMVPLTSAATEKHDTKCAPEPPACQ